MTRPILTVLGLAVLASVIALGGVQFVTSVMDAPPIVRGLAPTPCCGNESAALTARLQTLLHAGTPDIDVRRALHRCAAF
jgi:hypothetical protein